MDETRTRKKYDKQFKRNARLVAEGGKPVTAVARDCAHPHTTVRNCRTKQIVVKKALTATS